MGRIANLRNPLTPETIDSLLEFSPNVLTIKLFESFLVIAEVEQCALFTHKRGVL